MAELLEVATVPLEESLLHEDVLLDTVFFCIGDVLIPREIGAILALDLLLNQFSKPVWPGEEPIVLDDLKLFSDCLLRDTYSLPCEDFRAQIGLLEADDLVLDAAAFTVCGLVGDHGENVVLHF